MMRLRFLNLLGLVAIFALAPFSHVAAYYRSPIDLTDDDYILFGDADHSRYEAYDMYLVVDEDSISSQWVDLYFEVEPWVIPSRHVTKFLVLANRKIVDSMRVQWIDPDGDGVYQYNTTYHIKPSIPEFIGGAVDFQIVAVEEVGEAQYAVAWTQRSKMYYFDDLPVKDREAISVLRAILEKLREILAELQNTNDLLNRISKQIETMFTPSAQAKDRLYDAIDKLWDKTPMKDLLDNSDRMRELFEGTPTNPAYSQLQLGPKRDWFGVGVQHYLIDLTQWRSEVEKIRTLLEAIIWVEFFIFLVRYLQPKLQL